MKFDRTLNTQKNVFSGIIYRVVSLIVPFIIRTLIIQKLGIEYLGLSSLFVSILQILNLTELGFGSAIVYTMYKPIARDDMDKIGSILYFYKRVYKILGSIIFIFGLLILPFLRYLINDFDMLVLNVNIYVVFLIYLINTTVTYFFFAYKKSLLMAFHKNSLLNLANLVSHIILYSLQIMAIFIFDSFYLYVILLPIFTVLDNLIINYITNKMFPDILNSKKLSLEEVQQIKHKIKALAGHKIGAVVLVSFDNIVISAFLNLTILTVYNNYYYVISALVGFINIGFNSILAGLGNSLETESRNKNYTIFKELNYINAWIVSFCTVSLLILYQPFMFLWMGEDLMFSYKIIILLGIYFYFWQIRVIGLGFKDAAGMWSKDFWKPYIGVFVNLVINIILVLWIGLSGVLLTTIFVMVFIYFPIETYVLYKWLFKRNCIGYLKNQLLYLTITIISSLTSIYIASFIDDSSIKSFIIKIFICLVIPNIIFLIMSFKTEGFILVLKRIKIVIKNINV